LDELALLFLEDAFARVRPFAEELRVLERSLELPLAFVFCWGI
jgi:hypothetical protein